MSRPIIEVRNLSKVYQLGRIGATSLRDEIGRLWDHVHGRQKRVLKGEFWALKDVSFEVQPGEVVGIIGRNGAGKSTLLKILSRITQQTSGEITLRGRVASLLEVGTGFHPDLTGRENIFLNGAILGMTKAEIRRKLDEIIAFAEVEQFIDTPVKRYSSGMYVRLAFAVAAHLEPEILMVDEVLAVGDAQFQRKCLQKVGAVAKEGRTILFVSHNMGSVAQISTKGILLEKGRIKLEAPAIEATRAYLQGLTGENRMEQQTFLGPLAQTVEFHSISVQNPGLGESRVLSPSHPIEVVIRGRSRRKISFFRVTFSLFREGTRLLTMHDVQHPATLEEGAFESRFEIPPSFLRPGEYSVALGGHRDGMHEWLWATDLSLFTVAEEWSANYDPANIGWVNLPESGTRTSIAT